MKKSELRKLIRKIISEQAVRQKEPNRTPPPPPPPPPPPGPDTATPNKQDGIVKPYRPPVSFIKPQDLISSAQGIDGGNPTCNQVFTSLVQNATVAAVSNPAGNIPEYVDLEALAPMLDAIVDTCNNPDEQCLSNGSLQPMPPVCGCSETLDPNSYNLDNIYTIIQTSNYQWQIQGGGGTAFTQQLIYPPECPQPEPGEPGGDPIIDLDAMDNVDCTGANEYICDSGICESSMIYSDPNIFITCYACCYNQDAAAMGVSPQDVATAVDKIK